MLSLRFGFFGFALTCLWISAGAQAGGNSSGGGAHVESAYRIQAYELIGKIALSPAADKLCPAASLKTILERTKIKVVDSLVDPKTRRPILDQNLDAWSVPGLIQLKKASWDAFFNDRASAETKSIEALILHEVYRATGDLCGDDNFRISNQVLGMIADLPQYSRVYSFTHSVWRKEAGDWKDAWAFCDAKADAIGKELTCFEAITDSVFLFKAKVTQVGSDKEAAVLDETIFASATDLSTVVTNRMGNLRKLMSLQHPFYIVLDLETGALAYGLNLGHLNPL